MSAPQSQRTSVSSGHVEKKSRWSRFVDELKPIEEPQAPVGIYSPIPKTQAKKNSISSETEQTKGQKALKAYRKFQDIVGGPTYKMYI